MEEGVGAERVQQVAPRRKVQVLRDEDAELAGDADGEVVGHV